MDLNAPMTLGEWRQIPLLPGMESIAKEFETNWEALLIEQGKVLKLANGSTLYCEMPSEGEPLKSI